MTASARVTNARDLERALSRVDTAVRGQATRVALRAGAAKIVNQARENAPVLSGQLSRSIHSEVAVEGDGGVARIGTNLEYAAIQEFGGVIKFKTRKGTVTIKGKRYLTRAYDTKRGEATNEMADVLADFIRRA